MNEYEIIPRDCALIANELGFHEKVYDFYTTVDGTLYEAKRELNPKMEDFNDGSWHNRFSAPTKNQIRLWLIENYDIHISSKKLIEPSKFKMSEDSIFNLNLLVELRKINQ